MNETKVIGNELFYFPRCDSCRTQMEWLRIWEYGKLVHEEALCPKCRKPELSRLTPDGKQTKVKLLEDGTFSLG